LALAHGNRLGPYEIVAPLGVGGMGEVYKARDTRLDRAVAVKILPESLAADPQFRERLDREARAISRLTHANICTLYDVGEQDGTAFLIMELLDGETLAARLKKGALPLGEALTIAIQIADALGAAHRQGIVHRDLKPSNVMLTKAGTKLLDFGLAKLVTAGPGGATTPVTLQTVTVQGTIVGTVQYMAPEQLEGHEADARSDIWAMGCVAKFLWPVPDRGLSKRLHRLSAPTLVIWGEDDALIPVHYAQEFGRLIPDSRVEVIPDCGHVPQVEQAEATAALVKEFLDG
jgi:serine/threonine protein kinase